MSNERRKPPVKRANPFRRSIARVRKSRFYPVVQAVQYAIIFLLLVLLGNLFRSAIFGVSVTIVYGFIAVIFRIKSDVTFKLAMLALIYVMIMAAIHNQLLVENFSQSAFMLLVFGLICSLFEQRRENKIKHHV